MFEKVSFFKTIETLHAELEAGSYLLLVGENSDLSTLSSFPPSLRVVGALFPRVIFGTCSFDVGIVAVKLTDSAWFGIIKDMDKVGLSQVNTLAYSIFTIVDGFSPKLDDFLENLFSIVPEETSIIGGGAGKMTFKQEPILFDNNGFYQDSALIIQCQKKVGIGVTHGWEPFVGPFMATHCEGHTLHKINFKDAFHVYKDAIEKNTTMRFDEMNFFDIAKAYPLGIIRCGKDFIVRDAIASDGKSLSLVGNIDMNSVISILKGNKETIVGASKEAALISQSHAHSPFSHIILIDSISRFLFLEASFEEELIAIKSIYPKETPMWGALTFGEIANANQEGIEFYNKTCVVGTL